MRPKTIDTLPLPAAMWHLTDAGYDLIKSFEKCKLVAYDDGFGNRTIGWGHTQTADRLTKISQAQADALLKLDALRAVACMRHTVKISLFQNEVNALASLIFNIGCTAFTTSHLLTAINASDAERVKAEWMRWNHVNGKVAKGLTKRRTAELAMWCEIPF